MRFENASGRVTELGRAGREEDGALKENGVVLSNLKSFFFHILSLEDPLLYPSHRRIKDAIVRSIWRIRRYGAK